MVASCEAMARQIEAELYDLEALAAEAELPGPPPVLTERLQHDAIERMAVGRERDITRVGTNMLRRAL